MPLDYFENRERTLLGDRFEQLYRAADAPARGITLNGLRGKSVTERVEACGLPLALSPFCLQARLLTDAACKPGRHPYHHAGVFYVQEPSAAAPAALLGVEPGMKVLDLCAAPGGKSAQLAAALQGKGLLVSNEYVAGRAEILKSNMERMGVPNAIILSEAPARIAQELPGFFDRVLVDAPCSGEGMFRKEPQAMAQHCKALVRQCAGLGKDILDAAAACLAPGGRLVYSTCTFAPEEDEGQIAAFLERHPEFELLPINVDFGAPGEENRRGGKPLDVRKVRRIWPCHGGEGHFMAVLQKAGEAQPQHEKPSNRKAKKIPEWESFAKTMFPQLVGRPSTLLGDLVLLPPEMDFPAKRLHIVRSGVVAGSLQKGRFEPGHQLFMVYGTEAQNCERLTLTDPRTAAWLHGEEIPASTAGSGWCAVLVDGFPLGYGKVSGGRVKNHYPKALRNMKGWD